MHETESFRSKFLSFSPGDMADVRQFFAPGRVNLIGEHIDYNGGHVFPAALTRGVSLWVRPRADGVVRFYSVDFPETIEARVDALEFREADGYANYTKGVIKVVQEEAPAPFCGGIFLPEQPRKWGGIVQFGCRRSGDSGGRPRFDGISVGQRAACRVVAAS
ncbi:galactokinase family protein [Alicyclobacillus fastidiosus]|uniref:galactokinase family protein n=1 Tax=Alicyclobacillus fastidiosus TaxID=392011 RepID=UPI0023EA3336|nr:hypothetical protein GCM10025859_28970 [Alicyclobacillus fastidiosus]